VFEIGNSLREARIRQGLGYPEVELATKIRGKYIRALEEEDYAVLPGDTYVRGFLRAYAEHLGLDGELYVDEYASRFGVNWREEMPPPRVRRAGGRQRTVERRAVLLALAGIAAVTVLVFVAWKFGGVDSSTPSVVSTTREKTVAPPKLVLRGIGKGTYVEVRRASASGKLVLQGTVGGGAVESLAGARFYLFVRRSAGLRVALGGKVVALPAHKNLRVIVTPERTVRLSG
jgi:Helix-turn-helix domain